MLKYVVNYIKHRDGEIEYAVVDDKTGKIIDGYDNWDDAEDRCKELNS